MSETATPTPARPALDAMAMSEGDEPTPEAILIAAWKLRFNKAFRPEEEAGALMAFLDTVGLCVVSKRSLADMRGAIENATEAIIMMSGASDFSPEGQAGEWWAKFRDETFCPEILPLSHAKKKGKANG